MDELSLVNAERVEVGNIVPEAARGMAANLTRAGFTITGEYQEGGLWIVSLRRVEVADGGSSS